MDDLLISFGLLLITVTVGTVLLQFLSKEKNLFNSWTFFLLGSALFVGLASIEVIADPKGFQESYLKSTYQSFVQGAVLFYVVLYLTYYFFRLPKRLGQRSFKRWPSNQPSFLLLVMTPVCIIGCLSRFYMPTIPVISQLAWNLSAPLSIMALVFCVCAWDQNRWNPGTLIPTIILAAFTLVISLSGFAGRRALISMMMAALLALYWLRWRYEPFGRNLIRIGLGLVFIASVVGSYSTYRHWQVNKIRHDNSFQRAFTNIKRLPEAMSNPKVIWKVLDSQAAVESSFVAIEYYSTRKEPQPFHTLKMVASNPIPRFLWEDKPEALGLSLPRDTGQWDDGKVNWGPGIVGHGFHEGGYMMIMFYAVMFGGCLRFFDELLLSQPNNPYILALLGSVSGQLLALPRGDIAVFLIQILGGLLGITLLAIMGRTIFGSKLVYPSTADQTRKGRARGARSPILRT